MEIREILEEEKAEVSRLVSRSFLASPVFSGIDEARYTPEVVANSMRRGTTFVAIDATLLGAITLFPPDPMSLCETFRDHPSLGLLAVDPEWAGHGIGRELIDFVERIAGPKISLSVTLRARDLIAFYERIGYRRVATFHWPGAVDPSQIMSKRLDRENRVQ